ncbi:hypothetical protein IAR50_006974 [Cryptococcus sp. DSM 104548]
MTSSPTLDLTDDDVDELAAVGDDYERERLENIKERDALLSSLGLEAKPKPPVRDSTPAKKPRLSTEEVKKRKTSKANEQAARRMQPTRKSRRVAERDDEERNRSASPSRTSSPAPRPRLLPRAFAPVLARGPDYEDRVGFERAPRPTRLANGRLQFEGRFAGVFCPNVTPEEMFAGGAFGGGFFRDVYSRVADRQLASSDDIASLPFTLPPLSSDQLLASPTPDAVINRFQVTAGQSLQEWEKAGWIWPEDPRGWAQWYTRFWEGRRCADDDRQVNRWMKVAGPTGRFKRALLKKLLLAGGKSAVGDEDVGRVLRQCLWQWAYELNENEFDDAMA